MTSIDGAGLVAAVGVLGVMVLVLAHRLVLSRERLAAERQRAELVKRVEATEDALAELEVVSAERRVDDLAEVRASVRAILDRAEAVRELCVEAA